MIKLDNLHNLSDNAKLYAFDQVLLYCKELKEKNTNYIIHNKTKLNKLESKLKTEYRLKLEKAEKNLKNQEKKLFSSRDQIKKEIYEEIAKSKKTENPLMSLNPSQWNSRKKLYPIIMENPDKHPWTMAKDAWVRKSEALAAIAELTASGDLLNSKIDLVKRIVTRSAMMTEKAQEIFLERLFTMPELISNKDLLAAIKSSSTLYSMMVWKATDNNWGLLEAEDQKILDDVLNKNLG